MAKWKSPVEGALLERLALLSEELGEAQQVIGKILRHGMYSKNPTDPDAPSNCSLLAAELGDVRAAMRIIVRCGDIGPLEIKQHATDKLSRVGQYLHYPENQHAAEAMAAADAFQD